MNMMKLKNILYCLALSAAMAACVKGGDPLKPLPSEGRVTLEVYSDNPLLEMCILCSSVPYSPTLRGLELCGGALAL